MLKKYIGDKQFYMSIIAIALPIVIQSGVTTFVSLIDNVMIGAIGILQMSAVSIINQLIFIFNLATFGAVNAAGIFGAQYAGKKDIQGIKNCYVLKIFISLFISISFITVFVLFGKTFINTYLDPELNTAEEIALTMGYATRYLSIVLIGLIPFGLKESLNSTLRENGETVIPMVGSISALVSNIVLNYLLIFGKFGFPELGITGAAIATVTARFIELIIVFVVSNLKKDEYVFLIKPFYKTTITFNLFNQIIIKGLPLVVNEVLWSIAIAGINQCYSTRSLAALASITITSTITNLYYTIANSLGSTTSIMVGNILGTGDKERAMDVDIKLLVFNFLISVVFGTLFYFLSPLFPQLYNATDEIKAAATAMLQFSSIKLPIQAVFMCCYFTLRCGGSTVITFFFDSVYTCVICWGAAFYLANYTTVGLVLMYDLVQFTEFFKAILGVYLVKKGVWINTLVAEG